MSAGAPAIPAPGPFPGSHAPPIGQLRVARRPNRPPRSLSDSGRKQPICWKIAADW